ncbi:MAG: hypothetical protein G01um101419_718 [Parcubacteria group bacterium Gr01-1014_19]|nr:MAG: hypothetical protein G01um101419_718 [Parcubacteria group bacterium Gr01-1014_19]
MEDQEIKDLMVKALNMAHECLEETENYNMFNWETVGVGSSIIANKIFDKLVEQKKSCRGSSD